MARDVEDLALLLQAIAGFDSADPSSIDAAVPDYHEQIQGGVKAWRIALADDDYFQKTDQNVRIIINQAAAVFEELGAQVDYAQLPGMHQAALSNGLMTVADAAVFHADRLNERPQDFGEDVLQRLRTGAALRVSDYIRARRSQVTLCRQFEDFFKNYDLLLTPTTPIAAPPISGPNAIDMARLLTRYTAPFNLTGLPAISIPCGFTDEDLPVGLQIIAAPWQEAKLLQAAFAFEAATDWHLREPVV